LFEVNPIQMVARGVLYSTITGFVLTEISGKSMWGIVLLGTLPAGFFSAVFWTINRNAKTGVLLTIGIMAALGYWMDSKWQSARSYEVTFPVGNIAIDGARSNATGRGAASHHGGIEKWITQTKIIERDEPQ
jgi:hypothetical protein